MRGQAVPSCVAGEAGVTGAISIMRPKGNRWHWMVTWDGVIYDPADRWPDYEGWRITSYLEILG